MSIATNPPPAKPSKYRPHSAFTPELSRLANARKAALKSARNDVKALDSTLGDKVKTRLARKLEQISSKIGDIKPPKDLKELQSFVNQCVPVFNWNKDQASSGRVYVGMVDKMLVQTPQPVVSCGTDSDADNTKTPQ